MKPFKKLNRLLLAATCASPLLANATGIDLVNWNHAASDYSKHGNNAGLLSPYSTNAGLTTGKYSFGQFESPFLSKQFSDKWTFSLAENSQVTLDIDEIEIAIRKSRLLDLQNLKLELFDGGNHSLGSIGDNRSLNLLLAANTNYSFVVSGAAAGLLGGFYLGKLQIFGAGTPTPVPIGDGLTMFTATLLLLGWQLRMRMRPA